MATFALVTGVGVGRSGTALIGELLATPEPNGQTKILTTSNQGSD